MIHPQIIGLTGLAGCGKDTVALLLGTHAGFAQVAFADALRAEICAAFAVDAALFMRRDLKELPTQALALERGSSDFIGAIVKALNKANPTCDLREELKLPRSPRQIMQWWGTEYRRNTCGDHYWTRTLKSRVHMLQKNQQWRTVVSDVRYANEVEAVRTMGGKIWQITRPDLAHDASHSSETDGSAFAPDVVINNRHDIRHLQLLVMGAWVKLETGLENFDLIHMGLAIASECQS